MMSPLYPPERSWTHKRGGSVKSTSTIAAGHAAAIEDLARRTLREEISAAANRFFGSEVVVEPLVFQVLFASGKPDVWNPQAPDASHVWRRAVRSVPGISQIYTALAIDRARLDLRGPKVLRDLDVRSTFWTIDWDTFLRTHFTEPDLVDGIRRAGRLGIADLLVALVTSGEGRPPAPPSRETQPTLGVAVRCLIRTGRSLY